MLKLNKLLQMVSWNLTQYRTEQGWQIRAAYTLIPLTEGAQLNIQQIRVPYLLYKVRYIYC